MIRLLSETVIRIKDVSMLNTVAFISVATSIAIRERGSFREHLHFNFVAIRMQFQLKFRKHMGLVIYQTLFQYSIVQWSVRCKQCKHAGG